MRVETQDGVTAINEGTFHSVPSWVYFLLLYFVLRYECYLSYNRFLPDRKSSTASGCITGKQSKGNNNSGYDFQLHTLKVSWGLIALQLVRLLTFLLLNGVASLSVHWLVDRLFRSFVTQRCT